MIQLLVRGYKFELGVLRFAVRFKSGRLYQMSGDSDSLVRSTTNGQFGSATLAHDRILLCRDDAPQENCVGYV